MIILCDTREQLPLNFPFQEVEEIRRTKLEVGDYSAIFGEYQVPVCFERKSIGDVFGTLTSGYERFKEEILRAKANNITLILIIEGSMSKVLGGFKHSGVKGISIIKTIFTLWIRYEIHPIFCKDRDEMAAYIFHYFYAMKRNYLAEQPTKKEE